MKILVFIRPKGAVNSAGWFCLCISYSRDIASETIHKWDNTASKTTQHRYLVPGTALYRYMPYFPPKYQLQIHICHYSTMILNWPLTQNHIDAELYTKWTTSLFAPPYYLVPHHLHHQIIHFCAIFSAELFGASPPRFWSGNRCTILLIPYWNHHVLHLCAMFNA